MGTTKGELVAIAYDNNQTKLANVDVALPQQWVDENKHLNRFWYVTDYNDSVLGQIKCLKDVAKENGVKLIY